MKKLVLLNKFLDYFLKATVVVLVNIFLVPKLRFFVFDAQAQTEQ